MDSRSSVVSRLFFIFTFEKLVFVSTIVICENTREEEQRAGI